MSSTIELSATPPVASEESRNTDSQPSSTTDVLPTTTHSEITHTFPPLTEYWTIPWSCTWTYNVDDEPQPGATGAVAWLDLEPVPGASTLSCYPDGMFYGGRTGVFSPGTCPHGWTTVSIYESVHEDPREATTTAVCCSSEYSLDGEVCKRYVPTVLAVPITYNETAGTHEVFSSSKTTLYSATIAVHTIQALFREEDKILLGLVDDGFAGEEDGPGRLSRGSKIGIGVGAALAGLLVLGAFVFFFLRWRRDHRSPPRTGTRRQTHELDCIGTAGSREISENGACCGATARGARGNHYNHVTHRHGGEPPPAYAVSHESDSVAGDTDSSMTRDDEIRVLRERKATIERRIEELERSDTNDT
ncbi:hypothetical protein S40285_00696 [Stachybotrys chlorohalonatus IBT 40285]|uniref:Uncharacterized protein n=1 Tax=Stachybotrys chlorohalonatus (strain IBT 40285) TaxID=1283841 RepID=A0A084QRD6_STAC4|nr:hypothetical protein S40285_00696 [Stachybotrys chlorohalonata IBT 40285]